MLASLLGGYLTVAVSPLAGFGVLLGLLLAAAMLLNTQVGLLTAIAFAYLLPFGVIPIPIGGVRLTFLDASVTALLLVLLMRLLGQKNERPVSTPLDAPVLIFIGVAIAAFILGLESTTVEAARFFLKTINSIIFYFSVVNVLKTPGQVRRVAAAVVIAGAGAAILGLIFYFLTTETTVRILSSLGPLNYPRGPEIIRRIAGTKTLRAIGTSIDPNILGGMLMLVLPLAAAQLFSRHSALPRRLLVPFTAAIVVALILTYSRAAWLGATAGLVFIGLIRYRGVWVAIGAGLLLLFFIPQGDFIFGRFASGVGAQDVAAQMRLGEYKDALRLISLYPWLGVGFGSAPSVDLYVAASSIYLLMAEEMGLVGLSIFIITTIALFVYVFHWMRRMEDEEMRTVQLGALGGVVAALTAGIFDHYFFNLQFPHTVAIFWLFVALAMAATIMGRRAAGSRP
ncbi:MAG: O-antigen ligase family protein [Chloroflexi bacterium]|nr:O-antigen ligase family protein [Chloroflexota bacterium]